MPVEAPSLTQSGPAQRSTAPQREMHVSNIIGRPSAPTPVPEPAPPPPRPDPESPKPLIDRKPKREEAYKELQKRSGMEEKTSDDPAETPAQAPTSDEIVPRGTNDQPATEKPEKVENKPNPWRLRDAEKKRADKAEAELTELRSKLMPETDKVQFTERLTKAEQRAKELENEIRFVNYEKSSEFQEKYHKPYVEAWNRAFSDLSEVPVTDAATGQRRPITEQDMTELLSLSLPEALNSANEKFGDFAGEVMAHRKTIKNLLADRKNALDEARTNGITREKQTQEQRDRERGELGTFAKTTFETFQTEAQKNPSISPYVTPFRTEEGKQLTAEEKTWNDTLNRGYQMFDQFAFRRPDEPGLTKEQRAEIIKHHAVIRNRNAAYGPLKIKLKQAEARSAELEKKLASINSSTPTIDGRNNGSSTPAAHMSARERLNAELEKRSGVRR